MKFRFEIAAFFYLLNSLNIFAQQLVDPDSISLNESAEQIKKHTEVLSSDSLEGRGTGTTGGNLAAKYIASEFAKYGLKPVGQDNSFYQNIPMHGSHPLKTSELKIFSGEEEIFLRLRRRLSALQIGTANI